MAKAVALDSDDTEIVIEYVGLLFEMGDFREALSVLTGLNAEARNLADVRRALGDLYVAIQQA